jgi:hypothetical protein
MSNETITRDIPAAACLLNVGEFQYLRKNETDKSGSLRLVARSGQPIEHWFWGRIVHDLSGMRLHKNRLPVDYVHDPKEIIGYLNRFEIENGDLVTSGALVPFKDNDRATEIMHKMDAGVPYEASINFGGDGIKVEDIAEGQTTSVNGFQFDGPGVVVREWPLRGVAICPYGADMNTESATFAAGKSKTIKAAVVSAPRKPIEELAMPNIENKDEESVIKNDEASTETEVVVSVKVSADAAAVEESEEVHAETVDVEAAKKEAEDVEQPPEDEPEDDQPAELSQLDIRKEFKRMKSEFGAEIAAEVFELGGTYQEALTLAFNRAKKENEKLRDQVKSVSAGTAAQFSASNEKATVDANGIPLVFVNGTRKPRA